MSVLVSNPAPDMYRCVLFHLDSPWPWMKIYIVSYFVPGEDHPFGKLKMKNGTVTEFHTCRTIFRLKALKDLLVKWGTTMKVKSSPYLSRHVNLLRLSAIHRPEYDLFLVNCLLYWMLWHFFNPPFLINICVHLKTLTSQVSAKLGIVSQILGQLLLLSHHRMH